LASSHVLVLFLFASILLFFLNDYVKLKPGNNCSLSLPIFPLASFLVEKLAERKRIPEPVSASYIIVLILKIKNRHVFANSNFLFCLQIVILLQIIITTAAIVYPVILILK
jgi:hypothetical protein